MDTDTLLQPLAERLGLEALDFDDRGTCSLVFDERFTITLELDDEEQMLYLYSTLGKAPEDLIDQLTCFAALLQANLFGRGTGGASLAFEPESQALMISRNCSLMQLSAEALQADVERFVQATDAWYERVSTRFWEDAEDDTAQSLQVGMPTFIKV